MQIGYARVSTSDQSLDLQIDALKRAGCERIFEDHGVSGVQAERPGLGQVFAQLGKGDTLIVWRLDRLARSMRDLVDMVTVLHQRGIVFRSLSEHIDIGSAFGEFALHVLGAAAHFERALIIERTRAGIAAAQERGVKFGRKPALNGEEFHEALFLIDGGLCVEKTARQLGIGRSTLYRYLADHRALLAGSDLA
jgi:DNA invertase Pin-like site-specific DNA recombinase